MTDTQVRLFLAVARFGSFSRAAESLFISEPAVSRSIRTLEQELNYSLIERKKGSKELVLTEEGKQFLLLATKGIHLLEDAKKLSAANRTTTLRVAAVESYSILFMPEVYSTCLAARPDLRLVGDSMHGTEALRQLSNNLQDLAIVGMEQHERRLVSKPLFREKIVLACSAGMYPDGPVHPRQLDSGKEIVSSWAPDYHAWSEYWLGLETRSRMYMRTVSNMQHMMITDKRWTMVPVSLGYYWKAMYPVEIHELTVAPPDRVCYAVQRRDDQREEAELVIRTLCRIAAEIEGITMVERKERSPG